MNIDFNENLFSSDQEDKRDNEKLFSEEPDTDQQSGTEKLVIQSEPKHGWKVLVVDDEEDIHSVTRMALKGFTYKGREIHFLHAYSARETMKILDEHKDIALILLDVVMESNNAGLEVVKHVRNTLHNNLTQIVLRTGYPGQAPEREVIAEYEINDYKTKTELSTLKLFTVTLASLRTYESVTHLENLRLTLEDKVRSRTAELEKKNLEIMEMDQMKTRFFSNISHEFRTPLTLIMSPVEEMLLQENVIEKNRDYLEMIYRNAVRLLGLVNQLLDLSKIDGGKLKIELMEYDINKVVGQLVRGYNSFAERKHINYKVEIPEKKYITYFDRDKLEKIITNLLSNAFKFTPEKGEVRITAEITGKNPETLEITVGDSGTGIPMEQLNKIFDRFYQIGNTTSQGIGGTGIGLSLTKELIVLQNGTIEVESEPGKGSTFRVKLPLGKDHLEKHTYVIVKVDDMKEDFLKIKCNVAEDQHVDDIADDKLSEGPDLPLVLIVEDNDEVRKHVVDSLKDDFIIKQAHDGKEGLKKAFDLVPDLIISDVMMPEMDGAELCERVKSEECTSHIPVILLTAKADMDDKLKGLTIGADDYITKPFNVSELKIRANNLIVQRKKLRERYQQQIELEPSRVSVKSTDDQFLRKVMEVIEKNMGDCDFDVNNFYPEMNMSRMQLFRKLKALVNQSPGELIRNMRLKRAAQLIKQNYGNIAEITYEVGFNNLSYFSKCFREKYGVLPSEFSK